MVAYLANHPHHWDLIRFVISNVGRGAARNVSFRFLTSETDFETHGVSVSNTPDRRPLGFLPQGETYAVFFGAVDRLLAKPRLRPFQVAVSYQDLDGRPRSEKFLLDVGQFEGSRSLGAPPEQEMAESLKMIADHLRQVPSGGRSLRQVPPKTDPEVSATGQAGPRAPFTTRRICSFVQGLMTKSAAPALRP
ncbi:MAG: hypothetical protein OXG13_09255 [Gemmatimonadaceae bacterium]|nr:hypothetical protein [Gemmatimonadaceae bacterium]